MVMGTEPCRREGAAAWGGGGEGEGGLQGADDGAHAGSWLFLVQTSTRSSPGARGTAQRSLSVANIPIFKGLQLRSAHAAFFRGGGGLNLMNHRVRRWAPASPSFHPALRSPHVRGASVS